MNLITTINYSSFQDEIYKRIKEENKLVNSISDIFTKFIENFLLEENLEDYYKISKKFQNKIEYLKVSDDFFDTLNAERGEVDYKIDSSSIYHQQALEDINGLHAKIFQYCESKNITKEEFLVMYQFKKERNFNSHIGLPSILKTEHLKSKLLDLKNKELDYDAIEKVLNLNPDLVSKIIDGIIVPKK